MSQLGISLHSIRGTGHHLATQSLATGSNASPATASSLAHDPLNTHPGQVLYFSGKGIQQTGKNGLWITTELAPYAIVGGLGQVSETIPEALNEYLGKDVRVIVPMLSPLVNHPDFQDTGVSTQVEGPGGTVETFKVFQRNQPGKPIIYAIANDKLFGAHKNLYFPREQAVLPVGNDAIFKLITLFNKAAAQLAPLLNQESVNENSSASGAKGSKPNGLAKFNGNADFVMVHDWLTSPFLSELNLDYRSSVGKVFMLHNTFNEARDLDYAFKEIGMTPPVFENPAARYSPLHIGVEMSNVVVANHNYANRVAEVFSPNADYGIALKKKFAADKVFDQHHGLSERYDPFENPALQQNGYTELKKATGWDASGILTSTQRTLRSLPHWAKSLASHIPGLKASVPTDTAFEQEVNRFKAVNKAALQAQLNLNPDPKAVIFTWIARPDPYQKGFYLLKDEAYAFLKKNPSAQMVIAGPVPGKSPEVVEAFMKELSDDPALKGRISFPGFVNTELVARFNAGSDFLMLPSLYEPYGLSQLEAKKLLNIPIVHGVDGLRTTVSDPKMNQKISWKPETAWQYGQTGILMKPVDVLGYWQAFNKQNKKEAFLPEDTRALSDAQKSFRDALYRGMFLSKSPAKMTQVRINGLRFVQEQHQWKGIAQRYDAPIAQAIALAKQEKEEALKRPSAGLEKTA